RAVPVHPVQAVRLLRPSDRDLNDMLAYVLNLATLICINAILAITLNFIMGYAGIFSIAGAGGTRHLSRAHHRRDHAHGHVGGRHPGERAPGAARMGAVGIARNPPLLRSARRHAVGRRAADGLDRPRPALPTTLPPDGRAVDRTGAEAVPGPVAADPRA